MRTMEITLKFLDLTYPKTKHYMTNKEKLTKLRKLEAELAQWQAQKEAKYIGGNAYQDIIQNLEIEIRRLRRDLGILD